MSPATGHTLVHSGGHWGVFDAEVYDGQLLALRPLARDPHPTPLLDAIPSALHHESRVRRPMVR
jgi:biotin/methionine sulfoxide reductase